MQGKLGNKHDSSLTRDKHAADNIPCKTDPNAADSSLFFSYHFYLSTTLKLSKLGVFFYQIFVRLQYIYFCVSSHRNPIFPSSSSLLVFRWCSVKVKSAAVSAVLWGLNSSTLISMAISYVGI